MFRNFFLRQNAQEIVILKSLVVLGGSARLLSPALSSSDEEREYYIFDF